MRPSPRSIPPAWADQATTALRRAGAAIRIIASTTPRNLRAELSRLAEVWPRTGGEAPRFEHASPPDHAVTRRSLDALADKLDREGELGALYAAKARELEREAAMCEAAATPAFFAIARQRYARRDGFDDHADVTACVWLEERARDEEPGPETRSDDDRAPSSLVRRIREEIGKRRLPVRVIVEQNLASLAATGDGVVLVAAGKMLARRDTERTVLHEIAGHVAPAFASSSARLGLFSLGTARGSDDQEGRALALERGAGFLDGRRRREIALRHEGARSVEEGLDFVSTARRLLARGAPLADALRITARVHRGGGLGREVVYLPALLRVEDAIAKDPSLDRVLGGGRVAVDAAPALRRWMEG